MKTNELELEHTTRQLQSNPEGKNSFFFLKTETFIFGTIFRYCHLFKWKDDCKSDYLLSEHQHSCSIQKLQRAFFDPVNTEMRAQRVLSLKKNSCINKSYLWKQWTIFSTKLYLSSLSWKSLVSQILQDLPFDEWSRTAMEVVCPHFPCASLTQNPVRSSGGDIQLTSHESRAACVKDLQDLTSVEKISERNRLPLTFIGKSWEQVLYRLKPGSKYKVAFAFLPNGTQGDFYAVPPFFTAVAWVYSWEEPSQHQSGSVQGTR